MSVVIGLTKRKLKLRLHEHKLCINNKETSKSAMTKHCWENNHTFNLDFGVTIKGQLDFLAFYSPSFVRMLENIQKSNYLNSTFSTFLFIIYLFSYFGKSNVFLHFYWLPTVQLHFKKTTLLSI